MAAISKELLLKLIIASTRDGELNIVSYGGDR